VHILELLGAERLGEVHAEDFSADVRRAFANLDGAVGVSHARVLVEKRGIGNRE
jgi:hypothetical protein